MCGRYTLTDPDPARIRARFGLDESAKLEEEPRYNIAPTDPVLAIRRDDSGERVPGRLRWGLTPGRWSTRAPRLSSVSRPSPSPSASAAA
jgi:putative SOS response-associated peptidase YedK